MPVDLGRPVPQAGARWAIALSLPVLLVTGCTQGSPMPSCGPPVLSDVGDPAQLEDWVRADFERGGFSAPPEVLVPADPSSFQVGGAHGGYAERSASEEAPATFLENALKEDRACVLEQRVMSADAAATALWISTPSWAAAPVHAQAIVALTRPGTTDLVPVTLGEGDAAMTYRFSFSMPYSGASAPAEAVEYLASDEAAVLMDVVSSFSPAP